MCESYFNQDPPTFILATTIKTDLNDPSSIINTHNPYYLKSPPYDKDSIDLFTFILFLSTFDENLFDFILTTGLTRTKEQQKLDCRIIIIEKNTEKEIFKLSFNSLGNIFYIQLLGTSQLIKYDTGFSNLESHKTPTFFYKYSYTRDPNIDTPYKIVYPRKIFQKLSRLFNSKNSNPNTNQFTAFIFYRIAPFNKKTVQRKFLETIDPFHDLKNIFQQLGGNLFVIYGNGPFKCNKKDVFAFAWLNPYIDQIFDLGKTIELDGTFRVLFPYVACIPQMVFKNTGIPLGILAGPSESSNLYSLFFESLKILDGELFNKAMNYFYITDEHKCFKKLSKKYNISIYNCYTHLIRSVGANSLLGLLLKDILYCPTSDEYFANFIKNSHALLSLYKNYENPSKKQ